MDEEELTKLIVWLTRTDVIACRKDAFDDQSYTHRIKESIVDWYTTSLKTKQENLISIGITKNKCVQVVQTDLENLNFYHMVQNISRKKNSV